MIQGALADFALLGQTGELLDRPLGAYPNGTDDARAALLEEHAWFSAVRHDLFVEVHKCNVEVLRRHQEAVRRLLEECHAAFMCLEKDCGIGTAGFVLNLFYRSAKEYRREKLGG